MRGPRASRDLFFYLATTSFLFEIPNKKEVVAIPGPGSQKKEVVASQARCSQKKRGRHFPGPGSQKEEVGTFQGRDLKKKEVGTFQGRDLKRKEVGTFQGRDLKEKRSPLFRPGISKHAKKRSRHSRPLQQDTLYSLYSQEKKKSALSGPTSQSQKTF